MSWKRWAYQHHCPDTQCASSLLAMMTLLAKNMTAGSCKLWAVEVLTSCGMEHLSKSSYFKLHVMRTCKKFTGMGFTALQGHTLCKLRAAEGRLATVKLGGPSVLGDSTFSKYVSVCGTSRRLPAQWLSLLSAGTCSVLLLGVRCHAPQSAHQSRSHLLY